MKKITLYLTLLLISLSLQTGCRENQPVENQNDPKSFTLFNEILFYDGYAETADEPVPDGIYRISNSKYVTRLSDKNLTKIGNKLNLDIVIKAACDNYDRIGNVFLSLINKGEIYNQNGLVSTVEIARFITPFMDKNKSPEEVPYTFDISNIAKILKDTELSSKYDFWIEFDVFGVPYAANEQISGCAGKNYTFFGTLTFSNSEDFKESNNQKLISLSSFANFNNYKNTDVVGQTIRTLEFTTSTSIQNATLYLITSNHGANAGGEEYVRRNHYIYFDETLIDAYKPGGISCEPFRKYNTQSNGIYGRTERSDSEWASWSNWCPGDVIPIRIYDIGNVSAGTHSFKIEVPDAIFVDNQGDFPLSVYIQGEI
ncbi:MAG: hypothetical protein H6609_20475 [Ignavibacteriales bacterium]|nr:hypothetical protein [Ignavibacteriales bacterium]